MMGCLNAHRPFVYMHVATIATKEATYRLGYFGKYLKLLRFLLALCLTITGLCVQPNAMKDSDEWVCSRFRENVSRGLSDDIMLEIPLMQRFQRHAISMYPPLAAIGTLFFTFVTWWFFRDRWEIGKKVAKTFMWISCAVGLAASLSPMIVGTMLYFAGPVYRSDLKTDFSINNLVATWVGFALHLTWVLLALWYDHKVGGIGEYTHGKVGESLGDA
jgi:hypothetical protein